MAKDFQPDFNVHLCVPGQGRGPFIAHLVGLALHSQRAGVLTNITNSQGSDLVSVRTKLVHAALAAGATHLCFIDDDMVFPMDTMLRLLAHELDVVGCNYVKRNIELEPVAAWDGKHIPSVGKTGVEQVGSVGFGFLLIKATVFDQIEFPWFGHRWYYNGMAYTPATIGKPGIPKLEDWLGVFEDGYFCKRLADAKIPMWVDHDVSQQIGHYGGCIYMHEGIAMP